MLGQNLFAHRKVILFLDNICLVDLLSFLFILISWLTVQNLLLCTIALCQNFKFIEGFQVHNSTLSEFIQAGEYIDKLYYIYIISVKAGG